MLTLNVPQHRALIKGREIYLTPTEWQTMMLFSSKPGCVFTREEIAQSVWGHKEAVNFASRTVDQYIARIRRKLKNDARIDTVQRYGYRAPEIKVVK